MKKILFALAALMLLAPSTSGAVFISGSFVTGINSYDDQSRELVFDNEAAGTAGAGVLSPGDVFYGFARFDTQVERGSVTVNDPIVSNTAYIVFSQTIDTIAGGVVNFKPTVGALSLSTLTGDTIAGGAYIALYESVAGYGDLLNTAAGTSITTIAGGTHLLSIGVGEADDFFQALPFSAAALSLTTSFGTSTPLAALAAGLSVLEQPGLSTAIVFNELVSATPFGGAASLHEVGISGLVNGAGNRPDTPNPHSYTDTVFAEVNVTVIPEPATIVGWSILAVGLCASGIVRRVRK
jgi:hypothetical protein